MTFGWREALDLWVRYVDFHWMFEDVPPRATIWEKTAIATRNTERGLRYLPVYMRRYAAFVLMFAGLGLVMQSAQAAPVAVGACATLCVFAIVALFVATVGFAFLLQLAPARRR
ncbi:MAG TPA: hypothetical protein VMU33_00590 [Burkholderiaceae bacterium]|nr:hypothetical protein [Burkholderiaceae bacterium]